MEADSIDVDVWAGSEGNGPPAEKPLRMLIARRRPASQSFGFVFADSQLRLPCLADTRSSGSLGSVSAETPNPVPEAAALGGFVFRTHQGSEAFQGNAATRLMAIHVRLNWVRFSIFGFFSSAIRPNFA